MYMYIIVEYRGHSNPNIDALHPFQTRVVLVSIYSQWWASQLQLAMKNESISSSKHISKCH